MTVTKIDLGLEYLAGIARPLVTDVGRFAVVRLDGFGDPVFRYEDQVATVANDAFATTLAPHLRGSGLTVDTSGNLAVRARPRLAVLQDWFITGRGSAAVGDAAIGSLSWNLLGSGTPVYQRVDNNFAFGGCGLLRTSASINDRSCLLLGDTETRHVVTTANTSQLQAGVILASTATRRAFFGLQSDFSTDPLAAAENLGFVYDSAASANWRVISRTGTAGSPVDTGVAASTSQVLLTILKPTAGTFQFYIGNTLVATVSSGISAAEMNVGFRSQTLAASLTDLRLGYFGFHAELSGGAIDDDTFLEA